MGMIRCPHCLELIAEEFVHCGYCGREVHIQNPSYMLRVGAVLQDRYYIGAAIGRGGFGITYAGCDLRLDMKVAIKEYYPDRLVSRVNTEGDDVALLVHEKQDIYEFEKEKCMQEARILADFSNDPGVVRVSDFFAENETVYIVMEYLDGMTLEQFRMRNSGGDFSSCYEMLHPVIKVLRHIHERGVIHKDISPSNIMMLPDGTAKLLDFGSASRYPSFKGRAAEPLSADFDLLNGQVRGEDPAKEEPIVLKPGYSPLEQYEKKAELGPWSDVYSFCATFYYMLTGLNPMRADDRKKNDRMPLPSQIGVPISKEQEAALMHGLAVEAKDRIASMDRLEDEFELRTFPDAPQIGGIFEEGTVQEDSEETLVPAQNIEPDKTGEVRNACTSKGHRKRRTGILIGCAGTAVLLAAGIMGAYHFYASQLPSARELLTEAGSLQAGTGAAGITIEADTVLRTEREYSTEDEDTVSQKLSVWRDSQRKGYTAKTAESGGIDYMLLTPVSEDRYQMVTQKSDGISKDDAYTSHILSDFFDLSVFSSDLTLQKETKKIDGEACYVISGVPSTAELLYLIDETQLLPQYSYASLGTLGLEPEGSVTAYISKETKRTVRLIVTLDIGNTQGLYDSLSSGAANGLKSIKSISSTYTVDYAWDDVAEIPAEDEAIFASLADEDASKADYAWHYGMDEMWDMSLFKNY